MSIACDHLKHLFLTWTPSDPSQYSLQAALDADLFHHLLNASTIHDCAHFNFLNP